MGDLQNLYLVHEVTALLAVLFATLHVNDSHVGGFAKTMGDMAWYLAIAITALVLVYLTSQVKQFLKANRNRETNRAALPFYA